MAAVIDSERPDLGGDMRHGDVNTFCPVVWKFLVERFACKSILDVGCGEGHAVDFFASLGVRAHGIDGLISNISRAVTPIALHDLTKGPYLTPVDLVWSSEVAEHIEEKYVDNYIETLCNGKVIAMTAALPGQDGHHHVNCQPSDYWIAKFRAKGYELSRDMNVFKSVSEREVCYTYFRHSGLVFTKK